MSIPVECGECGASYKVKDEKAGTRIKCPKCSAVIKVPLEDDDDDFVEPVPSRRKTAQKGASQKGAKKSKGKSGGGSNKTVLITGAVVLGVLVVGGVGFWLMSGGKPDPQIAQQPAPAQPTANGGSPTQSAPNSPQPGTASAPPAGTAAIAANAGQPAPEDDPQVWAELNLAGPKMKQITLAFHNYHGTYLSFVPDPAVAPNLYGPDGRLKLSWRVHLLPYLNQAVLYTKFKLDEAWDSPHNKPLVDQMPDVFQLPGLAGGKTRFVGFSGRSVQDARGMMPVASIPVGGPIKLVNVTDGTSNTAQLVLAPVERAVTWTSPDDLPFDPAKPEETLALLRSPALPFLLTAMMDGSVQTFSAKLDAAALKRLVHPGDGQPLGLTTVKWREPYTLAKPKPGPLHLAYLSDKVYGVAVIQPARLLANPLVASLLPPEVTKEMEPGMGFALGDIEQMVFFFTVDGQPSAATGLKFNKPVSPQSHPKFFTNGRTYFRHDETTLMVGLAEGLNALTAPVASSSSTLLKDKLSAANLQPEAQFVMQVSHPGIKDFLSGTRPSPAIAAGLSLLRPYTQLQTLEGLLTPSQPKLLELIATGPDAASADGLKTLLNQQLAAFKNPPPQLKMPPEATALLNEVQVTTEGNLTRATLTMSDSVKSSLTTLSKLLAEAAKASQAAAALAQQLNKLRQIGLAFHNHHDTFRNLPPSDNPKYFNAEGKAHLSWRVHILMFLGEGELYKQFHLDEPWDSPHNKPLAEKMPDVFKTAGVTQLGFTSILAISGPGTAFTGQKGLSFREITDGTSNTILVVEASPEKAVLWTKPDDLVIDPNNSKASLGQWPAQGLSVLFADGSVRRVSASVDAVVLKAYFTIAGGEKVPPL